MGKFNRKIEAARREVGQHPPNNVYFPKNRGRHFEPSGNFKYLAKRKSVHSLRTSLKYPPETRELIRKAYLIRSKNRSKRRATQQALQLPILHSLLKTPINL